MPVRSINRTWMGWGVAVAVAVCLFANDGFRQWVSLSKEKRRLERMLVFLRQENKVLEQQVHWIKSDPSYTEHLIRKRLGYAHPGEVEYHFPVTDSDAAKKEAS